MSSAGDDILSRLEKFKDLPEFSKLAENIAELRAVKQEFAEIFKMLKNFSGQEDILTEMRSVAKRWNGYKFFTANTVWKRLGVSSTSSSECEVQFVVINAHKVRPQLIIREKVTARELMGEQLKEALSEADVSSIPAENVEKVIQKTTKEVYEFRSEGMRFCTLCVLLEDTPPIMINRQGEILDVL